MAGLQSSTIGSMARTLGLLLVLATLGVRGAPQVGLGIFNVVTFPNSPCRATSGLNGTCLTADECTGVSGSASGSCASGFGVCCTVSLGCGGSSTTNNTYLDQASTTTAATCSYTLCPSSSDICQLRVDFDSFTMADASTTTFTKGNCVDDNLVISSPGQPSPPMVCGSLTGQHMYLPASTACHTVTASIGATDTSTSRSWSIKVSQIECSSPLLPPSGCLQYNTGTSGYFSSFGWTGTDDGVTASTVAHQNNQKYSICFRREEGYCSMQYFTPATGFSVGATDPTTAAQAVFGDIACFDDYLRIPGLLNSPATFSTATAYTTVAGDKICGLGWTQFNPATGATSATSGTLVTYVKPFTVGVHFDGNDELASTDSDTGFSILYNQKACA